MLNTAPLLLYYCNMRKLFLLFATVLTITSFFSLPSCQCGGKPTVDSTQVANWQATTADITVQPGNPSQLSQVVFNIACTAASGLAAPFTAGKFYFVIRYTQNDPSIGNTTTYPYGNLD